MVVGEVPPRRSAPAQAASNDGASGKVRRSSFGNRQDAFRKRRRRRSGDGDGGAGHPDRAFDAGDQKALASEGGRTPGEVGARRVGDGDAARRGAAFWKWGGHIDDVGVLQARQVLRVRRDDGSGVDALAQHDGPARACFGRRSARCSPAWTFLAAPNACCRAGRRRRSRRRLRSSGRDRRTA